MTPFIQSKIKKFMTQIDEWAGGFLNLEGNTERALNHNINQWLDKGEAIYVQGMNDVRVSSAYESFKQASKVAGTSMTISDFKEVYATELNRLSRKDLTKAVMLRNNIANNLLGNTDKIYKEFDQFAKESFGLSLQDMTKEFMNKADFYEIINFTDSSGRMWNPASYAEMWARTRSSEISSDANRDAMAEYDLDVVLISDHGTTTPICLQYEGKYFSLFGKTPGLPILDMRPPFHPNCQHTEIPIDERQVAENTMLRDNLRRNSKYAVASSDFTKSERKQIDKQKAYSEINRT